MLKKPLLDTLFSTAVITTIAFVSQGSANAFTLNNGPGDGTVSVGVDGFGSFGLAVGGDGTTDAIYNPIGAIGPADTTFESGVAIGFGGGRTFLTSGNIGGSGNLISPAVSGTTTSADSSFSFNGLDFDLEQNLNPLFDNNSVRSGSLLEQTYTITNTTNSNLDFDLVRYIDGDLRFDGSLIDGGGRLFSNSTEILFETDSATGTSQEATFVGITAEGGTIPATNRFEIDSFSGLQSRIISGVSLDDTVTGDGADTDQFIDAGNGFDVTLALANLFSLDSGETTTYTTQTIFGTGAPEDIDPGNGNGTPIPEPTSILSLLTVGIFSTSSILKRQQR